MKKVLFFFLVAVLSVFSQSKFAIEAGGGIDLVFNSNTYHNYDNGFSLMISPVYNLNETISFMASFAYHRVEGYSNSYYVTPQIFPDYSIDNPYKLFVPDQNRIGSNNLLFIHELTDMYMF